MQKDYKKCKQAKGIIRTKKKLRKTIVTGSQIQKVQQIKMLNNKIEKLVGEIEKLKFGNSEFF